MKLRPHFLSFACFYGVLAMSAAQGATTAFWFNSTSGSGVGGGRTEMRGGEGWSLAITELTETRIDLRGTGPDGKSHDLRIKAPTGRPFAPGAYETAQRFGGMRPGLDVSIDGFGCNRVNGRFTVHEAVAGPGPQLAKLAIDFEQSCEGLPALFGEFRLNSDVPFSIDAPAGDVIPNAFGFLVAPNLQPSVPIVSNTTTIYAINAASPIAVSGGEYSVNGAAFTAAPGSVVNRDKVRVRTTSPATAGETAVVTLAVGGVSSTFEARTFQPGQPLTAFWYQSLPGDYIGLGQTAQLQAPTDALSIAPLGPNGVEVRTNSSPSSSPSWTLGFQAASAQPFALGAYESASDRGGRSPLLTFSGEGRGCTTTGGRFVVREVERDAGGGFIRLAVDFQQRCTNGPYVYGELRYNSLVPLSHLEPANDTVPNSFSFMPALVRAGARSVSPATTIYGINAPAAIAITNGEYSVNGGPWTSANGTVANRDRVVVRTTATTTPGGVVNATLAVGGVASTFAVTTWSPVMRLSGVAFRSPPGEFVGAGQTLLYLAPENLVVGRHDSSTPSAAWLDLEAVEGKRYSLVVAAPNGAALQPGTYENTGAWSVPQTNPWMSFSGDGRGCNSRGRFIVHEIVFTSGIVSRAAIDFEQRCEGSSSVLIGEVRLDSTVPFSDLSPHSAVTRAKPYDFDGNGTSDLLWKDENGAVGLWLMNGSSVMASAVILAPLGGWTALDARGDLDGDGFADIIWQHTDGRISVWLMRGTDLMNSAILLGPGTGWTVSHVADLDGDGRSDLVWRHANGSVAAWTMNGVVPIATGVLPSGVWSVVRTGDFNADGKADLVLRNADGSTAVWLMDGLTVTAGAVVFGPTADWTVTHVADFNADGKADLLWRNSATGDISMWMMDGTMVASNGVIYGGDAGWQVAHVGDFDLSGSSDLLWRHTDGSVAVWTMNGLTVTSSALIYGPDPAWVPIGLRDTSGDGRSDILWRHTDGRVAVWIMNSFVATGSSALIFGGGGGWIPAPAP